MITHGGTGANDLVLMSVLEPGDNCVVIKPSYQQHYDIPQGQRHRDPRGPAEGRG